MTDKIRRLMCEHKRDRVKKFFTDVVIPTLIASACIFGLFYAFVEWGLKGYGDG